MRKNTICRNFDFTEKAGGILEIINLHCEKCESDGNCEIKDAYEAAKRYSMSFEYDLQAAGSEET